MIMNHDINIIAWDEDNAYGFDGIYVRDSTTLRELFELISKITKDPDNRNFNPFSVEIELAQFTEG